MNRRDFITGLASATVWPLAVRAQEPSRMARVGALFNGVEADALWSRSFAVFRDAIEKFGWAEGRNLRIDTRFAAGDPELSRKYAVELLAFAPDVILAFGASTLGPLQRMTGSVPIVFVWVSDPVGGGFVTSLARPGGNITGFTPFEFYFGAKWLELLKEIAPWVTRVAILRDPTLPAGLAQFAAIQTVASSFRVEVSPIDVRNPTEIEHAINDFARVPNGGLVIVAVPQATIHRALIIALAAQHRLPAVYQSRYFAEDGGLISYGPDLSLALRPAAGYVDRILRGAKPADLPVQEAIAIELVINMKAAKMLGIEVPPTLLASADEVIE
jgi:putative tryptophan/tyrosine transport system substrate-binding protein